ncbi:MAG: hypothetical protein IPP97_27690 [Candidatus Obscuribacter sp.]|nr:hypothetical protein [Candidatus Obscuribacter sp.]
MIWSHYTFSILVYLGICQPRYARYALFNVVALTIEQYMVLAPKPKDDNIFRFPRLVVIATLAVLATLTKQTGAAVVPAIAFALIVGRQWRLSLVFKGLYSVLISGVLLFVNNLTHGGLAAHLAFAMSSPLSLTTLRGILPGLVLIGY